MKLNIDKKDFVLAAGKSFKTPAGAILSITTLKLYYNLPNNTYDIHIMGNVSFKQDLITKYVYWSTLEGFKKAYYITLNEIETLPSGSQIF